MQYEKQQINELLEAKKLRRDIFVPFWADSISEREYSDFGQLVISTDALSSMPDKFARDLADIMIALRGQKILDDLGIGVEQVPTTNRGRKVQEKFEVTFGSKEKDCSALDFKELLAGIEATEEQEEGTPSATNQARTLLINLRLQIFKLITLGKIFEDCDGKDEREATYVMMRDETSFQSNFLSHAIFHSWIQHAEDSDEILRILGYMEQAGMSVDDEYLPYIDRAITQRLVQIDGFGEKLAALEDFAEARELVPSLDPKKMFLSLPKSASGPEEMQQALQRLEREGISGEEVREIVVTRLRILAHDYDSASEQEKLQKGFAEILEVTDKDACESWLKTAKSVEEVKGVYDFIEGQGLKANINTHQIAAQKCQEAFKEAKTNTDRIAVIERVREIEPVAALVLIPEFYAQWPALCRTLEDLSQMLEHVENRTPSLENATQRSFTRQFEEQPDFQSRERFVRAARDNEQLRAICITIVIFNGWLVKEEAREIKNLQSIVAMMEEYEIESNDETAKNLRVCFGQCLISGNGHAQRVATFRALAAIPLVARHCIDENLFNWLLGLCEELNEYRDVFELMKGAKVEIEADTTLTMASLASAAIREAEDFASARETLERYSSLSDVLGNYIGIGVYNSLLKSGNNPAELEQALGLMESANLEPNETTTAIVSSRFREDLRENNHHDQRKVTLRIYAQQERARVFCNIKAACDAMLAGSGGAELIVDALNFIEELEVEVDNATKSATRNAANRTYCNARDHSKRVSEIKSLANDPRTKKATEELNPFPDWIGNLAESIAEVEEVIAVIEECDFIIDKAAIDQAAKVKLIAEFTQNHEHLERAQTAKKVLSSTRLAQYFRTVEFFNLWLKECKKGDFAEASDALKTMLENQLTPDSETEGIIRAKQILPESVSIEEVPEILFASELYEQAALLAAAKQNECRREILPKKIEKYPGAETNQDVSRIFQEISSCPAYGSLNGQREGHRQPLEGAVAFSVGRSFERGREIQGAIKLESLKPAVIEMMDQMFIALGVICEAAGLDPREVDGETIEGSFNADQAWGEAYEEAFAKLREQMKGIKFWVGNNAVIHFLKGAFATFYADHIMRLGLEANTRGASKKLSIFVPRDLADKKYGKFWEKYKRVNDAIKTSTMIEDGEEIDAFKRESREIPEHQKFGLILGRVLDKLARVDTMLPTTSLGFDAEKLVLQEVDNYIDAVVEIFSNGAREKHTLILKLSARRFLRTAFSNAREQVFENGTGNVRTELHKYLLNIRPTVAELAERGNEVSSNDWRSRISSAQAKADAEKLTPGKRHAFKVLAGHHLKRMLQDFGIAASLWPKQL